MEIYLKISNLKKKSKKKMKNFRPYLEALIFRPNLGRDFHHGKRNDFLSFRTNSGKIAMLQSYCVELYFELIKVFVCTQGKVERSKSKYSGFSMAVFRQIKLHEFIALSK
jgi:hypothetical protein